MTDLTDDQVRALLDGATPGRRVQFHGSYCPEAVGTPFTDWDTSHDVSVIRPDGSRYRLAHYKHASDAYLSQMAPDLARALLDARAEHAASLIRINAEAVEAVAQARAEAQAAVALALEEAAENKEQLEIWAHEILVGLAFADVLKIDSYNDKIEAHDMVGRGLVEVIRALAPADGLAAVEALRVEARENAMQALASMGQAQEAYEAQLEAEAELARLRAEQEAAIGAVIDGAAQRCEAIPNETMVTPNQHLVFGPVAARIRALHPDATTAFARAQRQARNAGIEAAITAIKPVDVYADERYFRVPGFHEDGCCYKDDDLLTAVSGLVDLVRALIEPEEEPRAIKPAEGTEGATHA